MPMVTGVVFDSTGKMDSRDWRVWSPVYAESVSGDVVSTRVRTLNVTAGKFRAFIDPGVVVLANPDGAEWTVTVPDADIDLWDLIALSAGLPPGTPQEVVEAVVAQWLEDHPPSEGGATDLSMSRNATTVTVASSTGTDAVVPAADGSNAGVMTAAQQTKLAGIATSATANASDAALRDRATHTGVQPVSSIDGFTEAVQDAVAALLAQGTNVTLTYDDAGNTLTVAASGGGGGLDAEAVRDAIGVAMVGVGNITVTVNDGADTITISTTATVNDTDANLKARANHTGTQSADTITDGTTNKAFTATEKTKLAGVATSATANSADATLLARANHTGTQSADTIVDGTTNKAYTATEKTKLAGIASGATAYTNSDADARVAAAAATGTGNLVRATSPTLVTPALGTPASGNLANCTFPTLNQSTSGNAATATALQTARTINGVSFNGTANIVVADATKHPLTESVNVVATSGSTQTIPDPASAQTMSRITLTANCTFTFPTAAAGKSFSLALVQDGTGSRTVTWPASVRWAGGTTPTLTTTASRVDRLTFLCDDGSTWAGFVAGLNFT